MTTRNGQMHSAKARAMAMARLQAAHPEEWEQLYGDAREELGLPRNLSRSVTMADNLALRRRIAELEDELKEKQ